MKLLRVVPFLFFLARMAGASSAGDLLQPDSSKLKVQFKVQLQAEPFDLAQVRLRDGVFKHAQDLDHAYLLSLEPDRLLHTFRLNAGLGSSAQPLGGWEEPKGELRGHFVGHYLSACALMYASTGDERLKEKGRAVVAGLSECQTRFPNGYLSAYPEEFFDRVEAQQRVWAPYYTLHKIFAGLMDMYVYCEDQQALEVCEKFGDWVIARNSKLSDERMQRMLGNEHGGMNEALARLYALTGEEKYLKISLRFNHQAVIGPATRRVDNLSGLHANTQIPKFVGTALQYELTADAALQTASLFFWNTVVKERSYVIGGHSDGEMFSPKEKLSTALGPNTTETCNTYNMLKLTRHLFCWDPRVEYADYYERALYNHILGSQNPETGMMCYYVPLRSGSRREYNTPTDSFWCCTGTGVENHAKYGDSIYFHSGNETLFVNLFIASELNWKETGLKVRQETSYPRTESTRLTFDCQNPLNLEVMLRRPSWAGKDFEVLVNGKVQAISTGPGSWVSLRRTWRRGDSVVVKIPFQLRTEGFSDNPDRFAFLNGPLVLGASVNPTTPFPVVVAARDQVIGALAPGALPSVFSGSPEVFRAPGGREVGITLEPFYALHGGRHYVVYFDRFTPADWKTKEAEYAQELVRQQEINARTVDYVVPDGEQSERDHDLRGEKTDHGDFSDHHWRHAADGGWFSWTFKLLPDQPQELRITFWGSDSGNRVFDILIDDRRLATQRLENNRPGVFFDEVYPLPADVLKGKEKVVVRFQAHEGALAGGVFGARVMKAPAK